MIKNIVKERYEFISSNYKFEFISLIIIGLFVR